MLPDVDFQWSKQRQADFRKQAAVDALIQNGDVRSQPTKAFYKDMMKTLFSRVSQVKAQQGTNIEVQPIHDNAVFQQD